MPSQMEKSLSEDGKGKSWQAGLNRPASQSDDGNFFARGSTGTLKEKRQLFLLSAFADQAEEPISQMPNQQKHFEALRGLTPGVAQSLTQAWILGVPERLFDGH
ncbi:MAG: hypothetical protein LBU43_02855, partial [Candidatus Accumulibacter sp.]|nr:hypothetical protein [Accumulibacter sp.]